MRFVLIMAGIALLILGLILGIALTQQPSFSAIESAVLADDSDVGGAASAAPSEDLVFVGQPEESRSGDEAQAVVEEDQADAQEMVESLKARLDAIRAQTDSALPQASPVQEPSAQDDPQPEGDDPDLSEEEMSTAQQLVAELLVAAENLKTLLEGSSPPTQDAAEPTGGLQASLQSLLGVFSGGPDENGIDTDGPQIPSEPDCDADPAPGVNWSRCDKTGIALTGENLQGAILKDTIFATALISGTDFSGAYMGGADFSNATLESVLMRKSLLKDANFSGATIIFLDMSYADASGADFSTATLQYFRALHSKFLQTNFSETTIANADFSHSYLEMADFTDAVMQMVYFQKSHLTEAIFSGADIEFVDFVWAKIQDMDLSESDISFILFKEAVGEPLSSVDFDAEEIVCPDGTYEIGPLTTDAASLCDWVEKAEHTGPIIPPDTPDCAADPAPGVNWSGCSLPGINLIGVDLRYANLVGADLTGAFIYMSDLRRTDLSGATLDGASVTLSTFAGSDLSGASLNAATFDTSDLSTAKLSGANLTDILLTSVKMQHSDLSGSTMTAATISNSFLGYSDFSEATADNITLQFTFLPGANLTRTNMSAALALNSLDLTKTQIEGLDLSGAPFGFINWLKGANGVPVSSEDVTVNDLLICPAGDPVIGPITTDAESLCTWKECWAGIIDGDFETQNDAWFFPDTEYPAEFSQEQAHSPDWSVRTGIIEPSDNIKSFSSVRQKVTIPAGTHPAVLTFYLYPQTDEPKDAMVPKNLEEAMAAGDANAAIGGHGARYGDAQWVTILDEHGKELLRPVSMRSDARTWEQYEIDLSHLVHPTMDRTIEVYFGTFNNGRDGVTAMYVDDVYLGSCPGVPAPPPPPPPPQVCTEAIVNGGFEIENQGWELPKTAYPAQYSDQQVFSGELSMQTGISNTVNIESFSSAIQKVKIPEGATEARLEFYLYPRSSETTTLLLPNSIDEVLASNGPSSQYGDAQWALLLNKKGYLVETLVSMNSDEQTWEPYAFDLLPYKGHELLLYFSTYNNGRDGQSSMFVDDVSLILCAPETYKPVTALSDKERGK